MRYSISKRFDFCASHELRSLQGTFLPDGSEHPCARNHGHNYEVEIELSADVLDEHGMVLDYHLLAPFKALIDELDHRHINDVIPAMEPTAENLARFFYAKGVILWPQLVSEVSVRETAKTRATVRRVVAADQIVNAYSTVTSLISDEPPTRVVLTATPGTW